MTTTGRDDDLRRTTAAGIGGVAPWSVAKSARWFAWAQQEHLDLESTSPSTVSPMRSCAQRQVDAIGKLEGDMDVWVATGDEQGAAHLVPLSLCWHLGEVVVAVEAKSRTARNAARSGGARLALGSSRDVVMIDASAAVVSRAIAEPAMVTAYQNRTGWDPGEDGGEWIYILLHPQRIQVWRDVEEIPGRTVMRRGSWLS